MWPALLLLSLLVCRRPRSRLLLGLLPLAGFVAAWVWSGHLAASAAPLMRVAVAPDTRSPMLLLGCALALWQSALRGGVLPAPAPPRLAAAGAALARATGLLVLLAVAIGYDQHDPYAQARLSPVVAVGTALLLAGLTAQAGRGGPRSVTARGLSAPPLPFLGRLSYSLYLYNVLALAVVETAGPGLPPVARAAGALATALALAAASYFAIERPFLRLRARVAARSRPPVPPVPYPADARAASAPQAPGPLVGQRVIA